MRLILAILIYSICVNSYAGCVKPIVIAVIDTGMGSTKESYKAHLCQFGHKDFTQDNDMLNVFHTKSKVPFDYQGHGTNVVGIIERQMASSKQPYCIVVLKIFGHDRTQATTLSVSAIRYATNIKADIINYSAGGGDFDIREKKAVEKFIANGGIFVAAAGNEGQNMNTPQYGYYPAMYDSRIVSVSNVNSDGSYAYMSNYGQERRREIGQEVEGYGLKLSGTSQATAVATGKIAASLTKRCDR